MTADEWNAKYPVGTPVRRQFFVGMKGYEGKTTSPARTLPSGCVVVEVEGLPGTEAIRYLELPNVGRT